jgi:putative flavoprotein involved in K+ transport
VQLADELAASGRKVVLAVGRHTRMVRTYRGVDVYWWMQRLGSLDRSIDNTADHEAALSEPSLQLAGQGPSARRPRDLSLPALAARGVRLTGRVTGASGGLIFLADDLLHTTAAADARFARFLERVDRHVRDTGLQGEVLDAGPAPARLPSTASPTELSLAESGIRTVVWATGYRRSHPWLHVPVLELGGDVVHRHGVTASPGLYVVGWRWQTKRSSSFLAGMGADATSVVSDLVRRLDRHRAQQVVHLSRQEHTS